MKTLLYLPALFIGTATAGAQEPFANGERTMTEVKQDVLKSIKRMTAAFQDGDLEGVMASYEKDAVVVFEPGKPVSDADIMKQTFAQWAALNPRFTYGGHEVFVADDLAVHIAPWTMRGTSPEGGAIEETGLSVAVLRRNAQGDWKLVIDNPYGEHLLQSAR